MVVFDMVGVCGDLTTVVYVAKDWGGGQYHNALFICVGVVSGVIYSELAV